MSGTKTFQMRISEEWEQQLDATIRAIPQHVGDRPTRASFVRETVELENLLWRRSPYVCERATHFVLVNHERDYLYHREELLQINSDLRAIPAHLEVRLEKRLQRPSERKLQRLPDIRWGLNAFSLSRAGRVLIETDATDSPLSKSVMFRGPFTEGSRVEREGFFRLEGYAEAESIEADGDVEALYDRAEFEIDIPTRHLEILVVVDSRLFEQRPEGDGSPVLKFDIRNRDGVAFSSPDAVDHFLQQQNLVRIGSRFPKEGKVDKRYAQAVQTVRDRTSTFKKRLAKVSTIKNVDKDLKDLVDRAARAARLLSVPERFLFYRISWTGAHMGLTCSVRFPKVPATTRLP